MQEKQKSESSQTPQELSEVKSDPPFWLLRFSRCSGRVELVESRFQRVKQEREIHCQRSQLGTRDESLTALCIAAALARWQIACGRGMSNQVEVAQDQHRGTWLATLMNMFEKSPSWATPLFGTDWKTNKPLKIEKRNPKQKRNKKDWLAKTPVCSFLWGGNEASQRLRIFQDGEPPRTGMIEITQAEELLNLAMALEGQHQDKWKPIIQTPHQEPAGFAIDLDMLERWRLTSPADRSYLRQFLNRPRE